MDNQGRDYSHIDSLDKALALYREGKLERLYMLPLEFGGQDVPQNVLYVPLGIVAIKKQLDETIANLVRERAVAGYNVQPEYKGASFIPSKIKIVTSHPEKPGGFNP